jgi:methionyl-tRNA formyltransferase
MTWQVLEGTPRIPVTLLEAVESVDAGDIYLQERIDLAGNELLDDLRGKVAQATRLLCEAFVDQYPSVLTKACRQSGEPSYYPRRGPDDSGLDPKQSLVEQFELLRVVDNQRYPAFFEHRGRRYRLRIEKADHE